MRVQCFQFDCPKSRLKVLLHLLIVIVLGQWFYTVQILGNPNIQPLRDGHFAGCFVGACVDGGYGSLQLLCDNLFGFIGNAALNLFSGSGIKAFGVSGFVVGVRFAFYNLCNLTDGTHTGCGFFALRHKCFSFLHRIAGTF